MRLMLVLAALLMPGMVHAANSPATAPVCQGGGGFDPVAAYGDEVSFVVRRNGNDVGFHRTTFNRRGEVLEAVSEMNLKVKFLFITAYNFSYRAESRWCDDALLELNATTTRNGRSTTVTAVRESVGVTIAGPKGTVAAPDFIFPTEHWHPEVLDDRQVLNTITGGVNQVAIEDLGDTEVITLDGIKLPARHYRYTGQLQTEAWYDAQGRWVKLRFAAEDGSTIEYVCVSCRPADDRVAQRQ